MAPRRKMHLMLTPRRNLSAKMDFHGQLRAPIWWIRVRDHLLSGLLTYSVWREEPQTEASRTVSCLFKHLSQPPQRSPGFCFWPMDWDLSRPIRTTQTHLYWPIRTAQFGNLIYLKWTKMETVDREHSL